MNISYRFCSHIIAISLLAAQACAHAEDIAPASGDSSPAVVQAAKVLDAKSITDLDAVMPRLADKRVVFVGELHDKNDHHQNQLSVIRGMYAQNPDLAIGVEYFEWPGQAGLDDYIAGRIDEAEMLRKSEYFKSWGGTDYRIIKPILDFAREKRIDLVALNIPRSLHRKTIRKGVDSLSDAEKAQLPQDIDRSDEAYKTRIKGYVAGHTQDFDVNNMIEGQLLWDESMAQTAARYLEQHPGRRMVVLAGAGHIAFGSGIPQRLVRRQPANIALILTGTEMMDDLTAADFFVLPRDMDLPASGRLGVEVADGDGGAVIGKFGRKSAAKQAGLKEKDQIVMLDGKTVKDLVDLKLILLEKKPGDRVAVTAKRRGWFGGEKDVAVEVLLQ